MRSYPKITFGIIVLNGEPFTRYCLRSLYPFAHEIIVVEGANKNAAAIATPDGHSIDGTLDILHNFKAKEDPASKLTIITAEDHGHPNGFWPGDKDEQSRAYAERATGDYFWQVDIDEFYRSEDIHAVLTMLANDSCISGISFYWKNFWGGFAYLVDGWDYRDFIRRVNGNRRIFRWGKGYSYVSHRPPTVVDEKGRDLCSLHWISPSETSRMGIFCYHYGLIFPKQVMQRVLYYRNMWQSHKDMDTWYRESYLGLRRPFRILHGTKPPSWLHHFDGTHPSEIKQLIEDCKQGTISIEQRQTDDIERLLRSGGYRVAGAMLNFLYYLITPMKKLMRRAKRTSMIVIKSVIRRTLSVLTSPKAAHFFGEPFFKLLGLRRKQQKIELSRVKQVLVVRLDEIGDVVMTSSFLRELRRNLPDNWITLVVKPAVHNLVELCPYVNEVLAYDCKTSGRFAEQRRHGRALRLACKHLWHRRFNLAILPRWDADYYHSTFLTYFSGAPWRVGYSANVSESKQRLNSGLDCLLSHKLEDSDPKHEIEHNLDVIRFLGGTTQEDQLELWLGEDDETFAEQVLKSNKAHPKDLLIAFGLGAGSKRRMWPIDNFVEIGRRLREKYNARIVAVGGKGEESLGQEMHHQLGETVINATGRTTLRQTAALLKRCHLYVGNDAGPMHLAAAARVPVIEISCHPVHGSVVHVNSPKRFGPWGVPHLVLQPEKPLAPCSDGCNATEAHCILNVSVAQVKEAVEKIMKQKDIRLSTGVPNK